jgi:catechol 2,3-dioxygenase-like lactoylglutathione lyase family enzyme
MKTAIHALSILAASVALAACISSPAATSASATGAAEHGRFHHVHLNVTDISKTTAFYEKLFGVTPVKYRGTGPALMADRAFLFLNQVAGPIPSQLQTGVIHVGWSGVDGPSEFEWWKSQGVEFYTPLTKVGAWDYFYLYGPDREVIEIWTQDRNHRFNHVHMLAENPVETAQWFAKVVNSDTPAVEAPLGVGNIKLAVVDMGDVGLHILPDVAGLKPKERAGAIEKTDGGGIDHIAFSFRDLDAEFRRVKAMGMPIERPIATDDAFGVRSFFVRAPNQVLVELVEAKPLPEAAWE